MATESGNNEFPKYMLAFQALIEAENLAEWKDEGPVKEAAKKAAVKALADFLKARIDYHLGGI